jgi:glucans biosynthesis protein
MHGGAKGSGAPKGNQNALKHGTHTKVALRERAEMRALINETEELLRSLDETDD